MIVHLGQFKEIHAAYWGQSLKRPTTASLTLINSGLGQVLQGSGWPHEYEHTLHVFLCPFHMLLFTCPLRYKMNMINQNLLDMELTRTLFIWCWNFLCHFSILQYYCTLKAEITWEIRAWLKKRDRKMKVQRYETPGCIQLIMFTGKKFPC